MMRDAIFWPVYGTFSQGLQPALQHLEEYGFTPSADWAEAHDDALGALGGDLPLSSVADGAGRLRWRKNDHGLLIVLSESDPAFQRQRERSVEAARWVKLLGALYLDFGALRCVFPAELNGEPATWQKDLARQAVASPVAIVRDGPAAGRAIIHLAHERRILTSLPLPAWEDRDSARVQPGDDVHVKVQPPPRGSTDAPLPGPDVALQQAFFLEQKSKLDDALAVVTGVLKEQPGHERALRKAADYLERLGRRQEAALFWKRAAEAAEDSGERCRAFMRRGELLEEQGDERGALEAFEAATKAEPAIPAAWMCLGRVLLTLDRPEEAEAALSEAARIRSVDGESVMLLGIARLRLGRLTEARDLLRQAMKMKPDLTETIHRCVAGRIKL